MRLLTIISAVMRKNRLKRDIPIFGFFCEQKLFSIKITPIAKAEMDAYRMVFNFIYLVCDREGRRALVSLTRIKVPANQPGLMLILPSIDRVI